MAENILEREYVIPLRKEWMNTPRYKRTFRSVKAIKEFIAKHMRVADRDVRKVRLDIYLNNELWFRGSRKPPAKVKVKARKEGELVFVELADAPEYVRFLKSKIERRNKKAPVSEKKEEKKSPEKEEVQSEEEKKTEEEKVKSEEVFNDKIAQQEAKAKKHTVGGMKKEPKIQRKALKK